jgi:hypothetical protein
MNDISQGANNDKPAMTAREKELAERAGSRMLMIWLLAMIIAIQLMVIVHLAK